MQDILNFIITNKRLILEVVILIISVVVFILRKKPIKFTDSVKTELIYWLPSAIIQAEKSGLKGEEKYVCCLEWLYKFMCLENSMLFDEFLQQYESFLGPQIEAILSTPQKKDK